MMVKRSAQTERMQQALLAALIVLIASLEAHAGGTLEQLKARFNRDRGVPRLILLVSPTCPACVGGAQWVQQEILEKFPKLNLRVYAIWFEMYPGDSPKSFPAARKMMPDTRVAHFWDKKKAAGRWFKENVPTNYDKPIMWDAFYLYDSGAAWEKTPEPLVATGRTLLETRKELLRQISLLDGKQGGSGQQ